MEDGTTPGERSQIHIASVNSSVPMAYSINIELVCRYSPEEDLHWLEAYNTAVANKRHNNNKFNQPLKIIKYYFPPCSVHKD